VLGVVSGNAGGHHLFKGCPHFRILFDLPFDTGMQGDVGQWVYRVALKLDFVGGPFAQVCEFKRVVNVLQVHVFLHRLGKESVPPGSASTAPALTASLSVLLCDIHSQARQDKTILEARADAPQKKSKKSLTTYTVYNTVCGVHYMTSGISNHALFENLRLELRRGSLVLAVLAALRKEQYGYTLRKTLGEQGMAIDEGTLYPLLRRLESQGLLVSEWREEEKRNKRFYRLSADGKVILKQLLAEWQSINSSLNGML
jgi:PadR family transcriptional regulator PadR